MNLEDIELDNVNRIERQLKEKYGNLSASLSRSIDAIKVNLLLYELDETLLNRVNEVMYAASLSDNVGQVEKEIKYLADTFWNQF